MCPATIPSASARAILSPARHRRPARAHGLALAAAAGGHARPAGGARRLVDASSFFLACPSVLLALLRPKTISPRPRRRCSDDESVPPRAEWRIPCAISVWPIPPTPCRSSSRRFSFCRSQPTARFIPPDRVLVLAIRMALFGTPVGRRAARHGARFARCAIGCVRGFATPGWAFAGGLLAVIQFGR